MLKLLNGHPRDERISFEEKDHIYTIDGATGYKSTTTFIKKFFNEFDADKILEKMIKFGSFEKKYGTKTPEDVKKEWKDCGATASERGTRLHKYIEDFYNGIESSVNISDLDVEIEYFHNFLTGEGIADLKPYRTEWYIFDDESKIAGSIDMVYQVSGARDTKKVVIYDWKCSKEIKQSNKYERARSPIQHLDDCNYNHYSLQQNMYKYILEKYYGLQVVEMNLVIIHRNHPDYQIINIKDMQREIREMIMRVNKI